MGDELDAPGLEAMLDYLHRSRGFDFTGYKRPTLGRRIRQRMTMLGLDTYPEYVDYIEVRPDELPRLFDMLLVNATGFFRDPAAWTFLRGWFAQRVARGSSSEPLRVWCAGCASGEEAFTLAMLLADALGPAQYAERVRIYATDLDEKALAEARRATYSREAVEVVPPDFKERYFTRAGSSFVFSTELRRATIFGRHDLVHDAPISRLDLVACRNTLMYFDAATQQRVLDKLHFALEDDGLLLLGNAETVQSHGIFTPVDAELRVFARASGPERERERDERPGASATGLELDATQAELRSTSEELASMNEELQSTNAELVTTTAELRQRGDELVAMSSFFGSILASFRWGVAVLDHDLLVRVWNPRMEKLWGLRVDEAVGKPFVALDIGLPLEPLATVARRSLATGTPDRRTVECTNHRGEPLRCMVTVTPLEAEEHGGVTLVIEEDAS